VADGFVQRVLLPGLVAGQGEVRDGLILVVGRRPVVGEHAQHLFLVPRVPSLQPLRRPAVQRRPAAGEDRPVRRLLDQSMLEPILGLRPPPALPDQVQSLQLVERSPEVPLPAGHALQQRQAEPPPQNARRGEDVVLRRRQAVDTSEDDLLDRLWDVDRSLVVEPPSLLIADQGAGVRQGPDQLLQVERVAFGVLQDPAFELRRERPRPHQGL